MINKNYKTVVDFVCLGNGCISVCSGMCIRLLSPYVVWGMVMCVSS